MTDRREFLKMSLTGVSSLALPSSLFADSRNFSDYKALVVIYNAGGNDSLNMFIPSSNDPKTGYPNYAAIRDNIRVANMQLSLTYDQEEEPDLSQNNPYAQNNDLSSSYTKGFYIHKNMDYGTNALMPELAHLVNKGLVAIVANCGNLIEPATKSQFQAKTKTLPPFLFAHNHQTKLIMSGEAQRLDFSGWAGRLFDNWIDINHGDIYGMNIAVGRTAHLFYGDKTTPLSINANGPTSYKKSYIYLYEEMLQINEYNKFKKLYNRLKQHSFQMSETLLFDWKNNSPVFNGKNAYGQNLFSYPSNEQLQQSSSVKADMSILKKLHAVARLAYIGKNRGLKRQIFFVFDGGYDTHSNQTKQHAKKLRGLSLGLGDFFKALKEMDMQNEITTFNISDFARSTGNNSNGTDHAWGGSYFVMGGAVKGGIYGTLPDLTLGSQDDLTQKGRLIPTTSLSQYYATILGWFGVDEKTMNKVLPELKNFPVKDLGFMG